MKFEADENLITKGRWRKEYKTLSKEELELRLLEFMEKYPELKDNCYKHKREQIYLLLSWGYGKKEIDYLMDSPISSQDIDFLRLLMFLLDFDFVQEQVIGKSFYYEDIIELTIETLLRKNYNVLQEIDQLKREKEEAQREFQLRMGFLQEKLEAEKHILDLNHSHKNEMHEKTMEIMQNNFAHEKEKWGMIKESLEKENTILKEKCREFEEQERMSKQEEIQEAILKEVRQDQIELSQAENEVPSKWFNLPLFKKRNRKKKDRKKDLIIQIMRNSSFQTEQLEILNQAFEIGLSTKYIKKMALPEIPADNMRLLFQFFQKADQISDQEKLAEKQDMFLGSEETNIV